MDNLRIQLIKKIDGSFNRDGIIDKDLAHTLTVTLGRTPFLCVDPTHNVQLSFHLCLKPMRSLHLLSESLDKPSSGRTVDDVVIERHCETEVLPGGEFPIDDAWLHPDTSDGQLQRIIRWANCPPAARTEHADRGYCDRPRELFPQRWKQLREPATSAARNHWAANGLFGPTALVDVYLDCSESVESRRESIG